ncbi:MAG TPA: hypothetical protein VES20_14935 [Bryobacteraceae bacterium]|nr:hypothetical protein [Bryobacteraceae bacterium]
MIRPRPGPTLTTRPASFAMHFRVIASRQPDSVNRAIGYNTFPNISVAQYKVRTGLSVTSGSSAEVSGLNGANKSETPQDTWHLQYQVTYLRGRQKFKIGAETQQLRLDTFSTNSPAGAYFFDRHYTQGPDPLARSSTGGHGFASFLLGVFGI